jgi:hypothetical protein
VGFLIPSRQAGLAQRHSAFVATVKLLSRVRSVQALLLGEQTSQFQPQRFECNSLVLENLLFGREPVAVPSAFGFIFHLTRAGDPDLS